MRKTQTNQIVDIGGVVGTELLHAHADDERAPLWEPTWYYLDGMWYSDTGEVVPDKKKGKQRTYGCNNAKERLKEEL